jgi:tRNA (mo5U34)-methyltransferase
MSPQELRAEVARIPWWHHINLGNGIVTPGRDHEKSVPKLDRLALPDLTGKTVLDVGAWDGFFSFEAERRGASRVLATDYFCWDHGGWGTKAGFELARRALDSKVEDMDIDVMDISKEALGGSFDVVFFLGVLYHLRHPLLALERMAEVTDELLIVETHADMLFTKRPAIAFYETTELNGDETNWCGPNLAALEGMLRAAGFKRVELVWNRPFYLRAARALRQRLKTGAPLLSSLQQGRMTVHAWK